MPTAVVVHDRTDERCLFGNGADWHFVNAEGREVLTALQHRLRELGETTEIVVVK